jgi:2-polyprenyl-3-methyl-5-hydroxy-6-metoxy-1,4-benzoquinol methylase
MYALRREVRARFPDPLGLPRVKRPEALAARVVAPGSRVLDAGAGDRSLAGKLAREGLPVSYVSADPGGGADFPSVAEAKGPFDAVFLFEVVEHLDPDAGIGLVRSVREVLKPGGLLLVSTPNVFKPGQFLLDATHRTPYAWDELGALCLAAGFGLEGLFRVYNASAWRMLWDLFLLRPLRRLLEIDAARSVIAVARKPG